MHVAINALGVTNRSGTGRYAFGLIDGLMRIPTAAARFSVLVPSEFRVPRAWQSNPSIAFYSIATGGALQRIYFEQFRLPVWLRKIQPDVFHSPAFIAPVDAPKQVRQVVSIHDLAFAHFPETIPTLRLAYYRWAIPRSVQCATHILTDAHSVSEQVASEFDCKATISAVPLGADARLFHPHASDDDQAVLERYGIAAPYILFVGTREPRKNLPMLLYAFHAARERGFEAKLVLAGRDGWMQSQTKFAQEGVQRIGFVADEHMPALYRHASALAAPSLDEGFNLPTVEALACGTQVIASDIAVHREILGEQALFVSPHDSEGWVKALFALKERNGGLRTHPTITQPINTRDWTDVANDTLKIYEKTFGA
ncbi:MAG: glycosyltransferase family 1 protein [Candidatus Hinthialibacter antarcticus]|nr:glycosyltransferase family 1 protein [Candidatus Hinthialibacter antarcticus]